VSHLMGIGSNIIPNHSTSGQAWQDTENARSGGPQPGDVVADVPPSAPAALQKQKTLNWVGFKSYEG